MRSIKETSGAAVTAEPTHAAFAAAAAVMKDQTALHVNSLCVAKQ
jgi:hypothetical protein